MISELTLLFDAVSEGTLEDYRRAVLEENVLQKRSSSTRAKTFRHLRELYALDDGDCMFSALKTLAKADPDSIPLLALLSGVTRDALLRSSAYLILRVPTGTLVSAGDISAEVAESVSDRLAPSILGKVGRNAGSSWTQSGHLTGRTKKIRVRANPSVVSVAFALLLGHLSGARGLGLYETLWADLMDASAGELDSLAFAASQRGLMEYRRMGEVAEFGFTALLEERR